MSIVAMEQSMTQEFLDGMIVVLLPSMLMVAWLVWQAVPIDSDFWHGLLDHQLDQFDEPITQKTYPSGGEPEAKRDYRCGPNLTNK
jgi:hypothetical protein